MALSKSSMFKDFWRVYYRFPIRPRPQLNFQKVKMSWVLNSNILLSNYGTSWLCRHPHNITHDRFQHAQTQKPNWPKSQVNPSESGPGPGQYKKRLQHKPRLTWLPRIEPRRHPKMIDQQGLGCPVRQEGDSRLDVKQWHITQVIQAPGNTNRQDGHTHTDTDPNTDRNSHTATKGLADWPLSL